MAPMENAIVNLFGDILCPACGTAHITPSGCEVVAGVARCQLCGEPFRVTENLADWANLRAREPV